METITCDPIQFMPNRVELGLDSLGLEIRGDGADWGDSEIELFLVRQALGEIPADRHPPNRTVQIPVVGGGQPPAPPPAPAAKLQKKIGLWQREGGFVRRDLDPADGFSTAVATQVKGASLAGIQGWLMSHRDVAPEVMLSMTTGPYFYGVQEVESELFKAENVSHMEWEIANVKGSAPGLVRVSVKNESAVDWKGLLSAIESRDLASVGTRNTTADIVYECEALTLAGGSAIVANAEDSSGNVVRNNILTSGFISVLSSKTLASGHMTHTGPRRFWIRAKDPAASANVELKLVWRPLSSSQWSENNIVKFPLQNGFAKLDLGEVIPEGAVLGEQRWEWRILARAKQGAGTVELDVSYILPTEQMLAVNSPPVQLQPDSISTKSPVTVETVAGAGKAWVNPANAVSSNNVYSTQAELAIAGGESNYLFAKAFGFAIPAEATITGVVVEIERKGAAEVFFQDTRVELAKAGVISSTNKAKADFWPTADAYAVYGSSTDLWGLNLTPADINNAGFGVALKIWNFGVSTGTASVDHTKMSVYSSTVTDEARVAFAGRSIELRSDGVFRQHPTDEVWGRGVPDGFLPYAPPSGLEGRAARGIIVPSRGDHLAKADAGNHKLSTRIMYFPGYHFVSEA